MTGEQILAIAKPILFNTEMVQALLDNRKHVTRRVMKPQSRGHAALLTDNLLPETVEYGAGAVYAFEDGTVTSPPYHPGDLLYVRETWTKLYYVDPDGYTHYDQPMYFYAADGTPDITLCNPDGFEEDDQRIRWHPSIHMPKEAARIFLWVTDVRAERLRDITEEQAKAEGFASRKDFMEAFLKMYPDCTEDSWLWVIEFERVVE